MLDVQPACHFKRACTPSKVVFLGFTNWTSHMPAEVRSSCLIGCDRLTKNICKNTTPSSAADDLC
jgi:hypothetical protein